MQLGELRTAFENDEVAMLESIIDKYTRKDSYYIFKTSQWEGMSSNVIRTKYTLQSKKPGIAIFGSKLWFVDNRNGTIRKEWDLPLDIKGAEQFLETDDKYFSQDNYNSAMNYNMPVMNA